MDFSIIRVISYYTALEIINKRLIVFILLSLIAIIGLISFINAITLTENASMQIAFMGSILRAFAIITTVLFVINSHINDINHHNIMLILSKPVHRSTYFFGRLLGFYSTATLLVFVVALCLIFYASFVPTMIWSCSLLFELYLLIPFAFLCALFFKDITISFMIVLIFYILGRIITIIQALAQNPIVADNSIMHIAITKMITIIALFIPNLNAFTQIEWLVYEQVSWSMMLPIMIESFIYILFLCSISVFDLYQKEF